MKSFAALTDALSATTKTSEKLAALQHYFSTADDRDKVWVIALFTGRRPRRTISSTLLKEWCAEFCQIPLWLLNECHHTVGDLSETIALLIDAHYQPEHPPVDRPLYQYIEQLRQLEKATEEERKGFMLQGWEELQTTTGRFIFNKLLSGSFRIGVSRQLIVQALARVAETDPAVIAHHISGKWDPATTSFSELIHSGHLQADASKPYPFYLAYPLEGNITTLGTPDEWQAEWKWDGIRGQLVKRQQTFFVWSRGEELMTDRFPEYELFAKELPDGIVIDGEILTANGAEPLPFAVMQTRTGRKNITKKLMQDAPVSFFAYDLLELEGKDLRNEPLSFRRSLLEQVIQSVNHDKLRLSPLVSFQSWEELAALREQSRQHQAEGFMLKRKDSIYQAGRVRGHWWKWKIDPLTIDAVLIYAQKGSGRRSNLYSDYTFAVKNGDTLVPFAKAYSGLTDKEMAQVDQFVKRNAIEKFGPVRTVKPELVFELAFEGIAASSRHKSGVALRFPRISRWRQDKKPEEINTLEDLKQMLALYGKTPLKVESDK